MKTDIKSNFDLGVSIAFGVKAATAQNGTAVDLSDGGTVSFLCVMEADGTTGTAAAKLQYSANGTDWTDDDGASGNSAPDTTSLSADGATLQMDVVNPRARYARVVLTPDVADAVLGATFVHGPLRSIAPV